MSYRNAPSRIGAVVNDIHFDLHDRPTWRAFRRWHRDRRPERVFFLGDFLDFGMLSQYAQEPDAQPHAIPQIQCFVREANALAEVSQVDVLLGNHDERWQKLLFGAAPAALKGALGLTLQDQCRAQGLSPKVRWHAESARTPGLRYGQFWLRHGHRQSGRFGGGKHLAATQLAKTGGRSVIFGHFHRAQLFAQTSFGRTAIGVSSPCMTGDHEYAGDADWQRGFTLIELHAPSFKRATAYPIIVERGVFAWGGKTYNGNR